MYIYARTNAQYGARPEIYYVIFLARMVYSGGRGRGDGGTRGGRGAGGGGGPTDGTLPRPEVPSVGPGARMFCIEFLCPVGVVLFLWPGWVGRAIWGGNEKYYVGVTG